MLELKFRAFRAVDREADCKEYLKGHKNVLKDYGITNVTSYNHAWIQNPDVYCVVAELKESGEMVGGIRIQISDGKIPLPVETAVGKLDPKVIEKVRYYHENFGVGELCGLWNARKIAGNSVSVFLTRACVSTINQLNFSILVGICADYTLQMFRNVGFVIDDKLGSQGEFVYPNENYRAKVLGILNAASLETAHPDDLNRMLSLRENPVQTFIETGKSGEVHIEYNLIVNAAKKGD